MHLSAFGFDRKRINRRTARQTEKTLLSVIGPWIDCSHGTLVKLHSRKAGEPRAFENRSAAKFIPDKSVERNVYFEQNKQR